MMARALIIYNLMWNNITGTVNTFTFGIELNFCVDWKARIKK